ncbi:MAG TPA: hypothetical protein VI685_05100 [Candidatus Angelobacter sp.]
MDASNTAVDPKASYEVNTIGLKAGPIHQKLLAYYNDLHNARAEGNLVTIEKLEQLVPPLIEEFERTECKATPNPSWLASKMLAGFQVARGDFQSALKFELEGYRHADEEPPIGDAKARDRRRSVSASNVADEMWRVGRAAEGLEWALLSVDLWPENSINVLVLGICAFHAGLKEKADEIFAELSELADFTNERDTLAACLAYERELRHMQELKSVQKLLAEMGEQLR